MAAATPFASTALTDGVVWTATQGPMHRRPRGHRRQRYHARRARTDVRKPRIENRQL